MLQFCFGLWISNHIAGETIFLGATIEAVVLRFLEKKQLLRKVKNRILKLYI